MPTRDQPKYTMEGTLLVDPIEDPRETQEFQLQEHNNKPKLDKIQDAFQPSSLQKLSDPPYKLFWKDIYRFFFILLKKFF